MRALKQKYGNLDKTSINGDIMFFSGNHINNIIMPIRSHIKNSIKAMVISPMMAESIRLRMDL
jgi:hypothetical protein